MALEDNVEPCRHKSLRPESRRIHLSGKGCASGGVSGRGNCQGEGASSHPESKVLSCVQWRQTLCSSWVLCLVCSWGTMCLSSAPNCHTANVYLRIMQQFVLWRKPWWFFWEGSCRVGVPGKKKKAIYIFFGTLNSSISLANGFVTQLLQSLLQNKKLYLNSLLLNMNNFSSA